MAKLLNGTLTRLVSQQLTLTVRTFGRQLWLTNYTFKFKRPVLPLGCGSTPQVRLRTQHELSRARNNYTSSCFLPAHDWMACSQGRTGRLNKRKDDMKEQVLAKTVNRYLGQIRVKVK